MKCRSKSRQALASNQLDPFRERVSEGVSANLCESLAELITAAQADQVRAAFSFAARRPLTQPVASIMTFGSDVAPILREAAQQLRYESPLFDVDATGAVVKLASASATSGGEIVMQGVVDGKARAVRVRLEPGAYQTAVAAHRDGALVRCRGDLVRDGRSWLLRDPRELVVVVAQDDDRW